MTKFARLEEHHGLQVLCRIEAMDTDAGNYGPHVLTRCDPNASIETKEGCWSDDDEGWDAAEKFMAGKDLSKFAQEAAKMCASFSEDTAQEGN